MKGNPYPGRVRGGRTLLSQNKIKCHNTTVLLSDRGLKSADSGKRIYIIWAQKGLSETPSYILLWNKNSSPKKGGEGTAPLRRVRSILCDRCSGSWVTPIPLPLKGCWKFERIFRKRGLSSVKPFFFLWGRVQAQPTAQAWAGPTSIPRGRDEAFFLFTWRIRF